jgi:hypothetical protein
MPRLSCPAVEAAPLLREAGFALLLRDHRPIELDELAAATGLDREATRVAVAALAEAGWLDLADGRVSGTAGLSLDHGPHRLRLGDAWFRTWCAYDALGIAGALAADAWLETACGQCGAPIALTFLSGVPDRSGPERLWLAEGGEDLRDSFCTATVLLCSEEHGGAWALARGDRGRLLSLKEASQAGAAEWADCAEAARRLA